MIIGISGYIGSGKDTVGEIIQKSTAAIPQGAEDWDWRFFTAWDIKKYAGKMKQIASILTGIPVEKFEEQEFKKTYLGPEWDRWVVRYEINNGGEDYVTHFSTQQEAQTYLDSRPEIIMYYAKERTTVRQFLQRLGTEAMRDIIHPNTWVNALFTDYKPINQPGEGQMTVQYPGFKVTYDHNEAFDGPIEQYFVYPNWIITDCRFVNEAEAIKDRGGVVIRVNRPAKVDLGPRRTDWMHPSETSLENWNFDYIIFNDSSVEDLVKETEKFLKQFNL